VFDQLNEDRIIAGLDPFIWGTLNEMQIRHQAQFAAQAAQEAQEAAAQEAQEALEIANRTPQEVAERRVLELVNEERANEGLHPLIWHDGVATAARLHAQDIPSITEPLGSFFTAENGESGFRGHFGSDGSTIPQRLERQQIIRPPIAPPPQMIRPEGITFISGAGENVAWGHGSPQSTVRAWMNSPGHRAPIMGEFGWEGLTHAGVGLHNNIWVIKFIAVH